MFLKLNRKFDHSTREEEDSLLPELFVYPSIIYDFLLHRPAELFLGFSLYEWKHAITKYKSQNADSGVSYVVRTVKIGIY